jgi:hypothetical protein
VPRIVRASAAFRRLMVKEVLAVSDISRVTSEISYLQLRAGARCMGRRPATAGPLLRDGRLGSPAPPRRRAATRPRTRRGGRRSGGRRGRRSAARASAFVAGLVMPQRKRARCLGSPETLARPDRPGQRSRRRDNSVIVGRVETRVPALPFRPCPRRLRAIGPVRSTYLANEGG